MTWEAETRGGRCLQSSKGYLMSREAGDRARTNGREHRTSRPRAFTAAAVIAGAAVWLYLSELEGLRPVGGERWGLWPLVALGVCAGAASPITVRDRRMSLSIGLTEIPVLVGIVFLSPLAALGAAGAGLLASDLVRRRPAAKVATGLSAYLLAAGVGILVYDHWLGKASPVHSFGWLVTAGALITVTAIDLALVLAVMAFADRRWRRPPLRRILLQSGIYVLVCTACGLVAVSLVSVNVWAIALFGVIAVASNMAYRATVVSSQRYTNLEKLYDFTRRLNGLSEGHEVIGAVLEQARVLQAADHAELVVPMEPPLERLALRASLGGDGEPQFAHGAPLSSLDELLMERGPLLLSARSQDARVAETTEEHGLGDAVAAPLQRGDPSKGYLLVTGRPYQHEGFDVADLRFFETLAANAGVALRSSELLEQLRNEVVVRQHQAHHDSLTGMANRLLFTERLEEALMGAADTTLAVMLVDLDGFKDVNDTLGHVIGDGVLREVARRLAPFSGGDSIVARLGGDEFAVMVASATDDLAVETAADQVLEVFAEPFALDGLLLDVRASMGVAVAPTHGRARDANTLIRHADIAMYLA
ncbi:MAG: diguanylate cyclase domain-containing protein, partial [Acidimicrobiales bacterium]